MPPPLEQHTVDGFPYFRKELPRGYAEIKHWERNDRFSGFWVVLEWTTFTQDDLPDHLVGALGEGYVTSRLWETIQIRW